jgi:hypothetical protein
VRRDVKEKEKEALALWTSRVEEKKKSLTRWEVVAVDICAEVRVSVLLGQAAWEGDGGMQNCRAC